MAGVIVLDASVLIAYLDGADNHHPAAEALLADVAGEELGINILTLAEVLVGPARTGRLAQTRSALLDLQVQELPFPIDAASGLAVLRAETGLRMPDCCVLLAAERAGATLASYDDRLARTATVRGVEVLTR